MATSARKPATTARKPRTTRAQRAARAVPPRANGKLIYTFARGQRLRCARCSAARAPAWPR